jgi:hypothetical protein
MPLIGFGTERDAATDSGIVSMKEPTDVDLPDALARFGFLEIFTPLAEC